MLISPAPISRSSDSSAPADTPAASNVNTLLAEADASCKDRSKLRSQNSKTPIKATFINRSGAMRGILWLDFDGQPKDYANLSDREQVTLDTFMTHPWMITDGPGNCLRIVLPKAGGQVVELGGGGSDASISTAPAKKPVAKKATGCEEGYKLVKGKCKRIAATEKPQGCPAGTKPVPETDNCVPITSTVEVGLRQGTNPNRRPMCCQAGRRKFLRTRLSPAGQQMRSGLCGAQEAKAVADLAARGHRQGLSAGHGLERARGLPRERLGISPSMRRLCLILIAIALGAAAPLGDADSDPEALITAIYQTYTDIAPGEDGVPNVEGVYSERLQALIDKDEKETPEGEVGRIDWDLFVDGQDWQLTELKIEPLSQSATQAEVRATFKNFGEPRDILYTLVLEDGHWRIDDIQETLKPRWTMSKILLDAPDAFPDQIAVPKTKRPKERSLGRFKFCCERRALSGRDPSSSSRAIRRRNRTPPP